VLIAACLMGTQEMRDLAQQRADLEAAMKELESSQSALVRTEKLAAVGQLAASVGHELRNPLAAVRNANTFIGKRVKANGADARVLEFVDLIDRELRACGKIIGDLLDFARERALVLAPTPLRALCDEAMGLVPNGKIEVVNAIPDDLPIPTIDKEM